MSREDPTSGLIVIDKPGAMTSHDVVARVRRLAATRRVGHAGTLDPMATGVLVVGVASATRLLHHLVLTDKAYTATIRLGRSTVTDDAEGDVLTETSAAEVSDSDVHGALPAFVGEIEQVPSAVSAVKIDGRRAYERVRAGERVELPPRRVRIARFDVLSLRRPEPDLLDVDVSVECSSGTYVRALARDLGATLGVGGHLTALRRTRVGPFTLDAARTLEQLSELDDPVTLPLPEAVRIALAVRDVSLDEARELSFGRSLASSGVSDVVGAIAPDGQVVALLRDDPPGAGAATDAGGDGTCAVGDTDPTAVGAVRARPVVVFAPAG